MSKKVGKVSQIIGPVVDVSFDTTNTELPKIYDSLEINKDDGSVLVLEVQSHVGEERIWLEQFLWTPLTVYKGELR